MSEFEYYLSKQPLMYPDVAVMNVVREMKLNYGMQHHIDQIQMLHNKSDYESYIKRNLAGNLGDAMLKDNKIKFTSYDNPAVNGRTIRGETIVMTEQELYALLHRFGIHVQVTKDREKL